MQPVKSEGYTIVEQQYRDELDATKARLAEQYPGKPEADIYKMAKQVLDSQSTSYEKYLYNGEYALTPFSAGIVNKEIVREYFKRFGKIATAVTTEPSENYDPSVILDNFNILPNTLIPSFYVKSEDAMKMNTREVSAKKSKNIVARVMQMPGKKLEEYLKGEELQWYQNMRNELTNIFSSHPELAEDFHLNFMQAVALRTGNKIHRSGEYASKQDLEFFVAMMKGDAKR
ncbi:MAG: hypothetical protein EBV16_03500, partial [Betaproteobacteria bacterium]|nr:hypothetical protein [Betaproteobacteria bacterium]